MQPKIDPDQDRRPDGEHLERRRARAPSPSLAPTTNPAHARPSRRPENGSRTSSPLAQAATTRPRASTARRTVAAQRTEHRTSHQCARHRRTTVAADAGRDGVSRGSRSTAQPTAAGPAGVRADRASKPAHGSSATDRARPARRASPPAAPAGRSSARPAARPGGAGAPSPPTTAGRPRANAVASARRPRRVRPVDERARARPDLGPATQSTAPAGVVSTTRSAASAGPPGDRVLDRPDLDPNRQGQRGQPGRAPRRAGEHLHALDPVGQRPDRRAGRRAAAEHARRAAGRRPRASASARCSPGRVGVVARPTRGAAGPACSRPASAVATASAAATTASAAAFSGIVSESPAHSGPRPATNGGKVGLGHLDRRRTSRRVRAPRTRRGAAQASASARSASRAPRTGGRQRRRRSAQVDALAVLLQEQRRSAGAPRPCVANRVSPVSRFDGHEVQPVAGRRCQRRGQRGLTRGADRSGRQALDTGTCCTGCRSGAPRRW